MQYNKKEQLISLYKDAFKEDSDAYVEDFFANTYKDENVITYNMGDDIVSCAHLVYKHLSYFDRVLNLPYLVAVSTRHDLRGKRIVENVMRDALSLMESRHDAFAMLYPFSHDYYRKYGFVTIDNELDLDRSKLSNLTLVKSNDAREFYDIFTKYNASKDIAIHRTLSEMSRRLDIFHIDSDESYILYDGDDKVGYALMYGEHVEECILLDNSILSIDNISYLPNVMARLVDIPTALMGMCFDANVSFNCVINVVDEFRGDRQIALSIDSGKVHAEYTHNSISTIDITIEDLTLFVLGKKNVLDVLGYHFADIMLIDKY